MFPFIFAQNKSRNDKHPIHTAPIHLHLFAPHGEIQHWHRCISLKYDFYKGTRRMKLLDSNEIRQLRDVCIFEVNGMEVYM